MTAGFENRLKMWAVMRDCPATVYVNARQAIGADLALLRSALNTSCSIQCRLRREIDTMLTADRALSLVVAIETALEDKRYEVLFFKMKTIYPFLLEFWSRSI